MINPAARAAWRTVAGRVEDDADPGPLPTALKPTRSGPSRSAAAARPTARAIPAEPARAAPPHPPGDRHQAEARSHRLVGRLHDAPGAGGDAAEVLAELTAIYGVTTRDQGRI